ncbi:MAG: PP2C family serine/threonine-protein phosphatase [Nostoc sp. DedQUE11]|nr:PP2C family serine/threonine-protein phosphatase [Nostoc sp. DedQUE11]
MVEEKNHVKWRVGGETAKGATHVRHKLPNQDYIDWWQPSRMALPIVLVVSDGHGSAKSFRSDLGSRFAVEKAIDALKTFVDQPDDDNLAAVKNYAEEQLPKELVTQWKQTVEEHLGKQPFKDEEWQQLTEKDGTGAARPVVEKNPLLAYGATVLAVLVTESFILYLQLGDGDILCVDSSGETTRPFPQDQKLIANETTSLCMEDAWREIRIRFVPHSGEDSLSMILVSTDGYANSFTTEEDFCKIGRDYLAMIRDEGFDAIERQLKRFLIETSDQGSGDDITLGIIKRIDEKDTTDILKEMNRRLNESEAAHEKTENELEKFKKRQETDSKLNLQHLNNFRQQQQTEITDLQTQIADIENKLITQKQAFKQRIDSLANALIATIIFIIISIISALTLWFWSARTQTPSPPGSTQIR